MQSLTERVYKLGPPGGLFDESVVATLFPRATPGAARLLVHRAVRKGEVLRLKPGYYCLAPDYRKTEPHPFVVAAFLHSPSHVSLESALSHYGLIPEAVFGVSSVTTKRSRSFRTPLGEFTFRRVPAKNPRVGISAVDLHQSGWAFVASPLRAIADLVYLRKDVRWGRDGLEFLTRSLRIEEDDLRALPMDQVDGLMQNFTNRRVVTYLAGMKKVLER